MVTTIEDLLLARAQARLGPVVRQYAPLPGGLAQLAAILRAQGAQPPAVFAAWRGGQRPAGRMVDGRLIRPAGLRLKSAWSLLAVTQDPGGELARRRGDAVRGTIGGSALAARLGLALHDYTLPGIGTAEVEGVGPLDSADLAELGVTIMEVHVILEHDLESDAADADAGLDDFITFAAQVDLAPRDGVPEAADVLTLPQ